MGKARGMQGYGNEKAFYIHKQKDRGKDDHNVVYYLYHYVYGAASGMDTDHGYRDPFC